MYTSVIVTAASTMASFKECLLSEDVAYAKIDAVFCIVCASAACHIRRHAHVRVNCPPGGWAQCNCSISLMAHALHTSILLVVKLCLLTQATRLPAGPC